MRLAVGCLVAFVVLLGSVNPIGAQVDLSDLPPSYAADIAAAQKKADDAARALGEAETRLYELESEIARVEARVEDTEARLADLKTRVRESAINQYVRAGTGIPSIYDEDLNRQARANAMAELVTRGDTDALDDYRAVTEDLERARTQLNTLVSQQQDHLERLEGAQTDLTGELERLQSLEAERQREIARREEAERARQAEIERKRQEEAARQRAATNRSRPVTTPPAAGGGSSGSPSPSTPTGSSGFICPVQGPHSFIDSWGFPRSGGRAHKGVDMMAARGTPVVAPVAGTVAHRGNSVGGLSYHLNGVDGNYYYGTHLSAYGASGAVQAGEIIGYVGDTGNARGTPHLHFEIHPNGGAAVNPYPTVRAAC